MNTLIIHPRDPSTEFLKIIYRNLECTVLDDMSSSSKIRKGLQEHQKIILLGHGTETGLLSPYGGEQFGRLIVGPREVNFLRGKEVISVFCNSNIFGIKYGLSGLFSGMIISEESEAYDWLGQFIEEKEIRKHNREWCRNLEKLILSGVPLPEIPEKMRKNKGNDLELFNYESLYYLENGEEKEF
jgi:hypothetical protein